jgi:hypothetical protein
MSDQDRLTPNMALYTTIFSLVGVAPALPLTWFTTERRTQPSAAALLLRYFYSNRTLLHNTVLYYTVYYSIIQKCHYHVHPLFLPYRCGSCAQSRCNARSVALRAPSSTALHRRHDCQPLSQ